MSDERDPMIEALRRVANDLKRTELLARNFRLLPIAADDKSNAESFKIVADALKDIQTGIGMVLSVDSEEEKTSAPPAFDAETFKEKRVPYLMRYIQDALNWTRYRAGGKGLSACWVNSRADGTPNGPESPYGRLRLVPDGTDEIWALSTFPETSYERCKHCGEPNDRADVSNERICGKCIDRLTEQHIAAQEDAGEEIARQADEERGGGILAAESEPEGKVPHEWPYVCPRCKSMNVSSLPDGFDSCRFTCASCKTVWRAGRRAHTEAWVELPL